MVVVVAEAVAVVVVVVVAAVVLGEPVAAAAAVRWRLVQGLPWVAGAAGATGRRCTATCRSLRRL